MFKDKEVEVEVESTVPDTKLHEVEQAAMWHFSNAGIYPLGAEAVPL